MSTEEPGLAVAFAPDVTPAVTVLTGSHTGRKSVVTFSGGPRPGANRGRRSLGFPGFLRFFPSTRISVFSRLGVPSFFCA